MALPRIDLPLFELTIPSSGKKVQYRPFTVKEEKILLIAQESKEIDQIILAIKQILGNCIEGINVDKLAVFDIEYIMLNVRGKSVDNIIKFTINDPDTEETIELAINIDDVKVKFKDDHNKNIKLNDDYTLVMRYPSINELKALSNLRRDNPEASNNAQVFFDVMISCIDMLVSSDGEKIYKMADFTQQEIQDFVDSLTSSAIKNIQRFFETAPILKIEAPYKNKNGDKKTFVMEGMESFFI